MEIHSDRSSVKTLNTFFLFLIFIGLKAGAVPTAVNFQANIRKPDGTKLEASDVSFRLKYSNSLGTCTVYIEDFSNVSMVGSNGNISFKMGSGSKVFPPTGATLASTFSNASNNTMDCFEGATYTPLSSTEKRILKLEFAYTGSGGLQAINGIEVNTVPYALYANEAENATKLGGTAAALFAKFSDFTTCTGGQVLTFNGSTFSCVLSGTSNLVGDVTGPLGTNVVATVGGKTAANIATSVTDTTNATNAATPSRLVKRDGSGDASFATARATNFSGRNLLLFETTDTNKVTLKAPTTFTAGDYTLTLPASKGTNGQVLSTDGNGVTTWVNGAAGAVTNVTASAPLVSTGGTTPNITMPAATGSVDGYLTAANFTSFNNKISSQWTTAGSDIYFNSGKVGIGTVSPAGPLHVAGTNNLESPSVPAQLIVSPSSNLAKRLYMGYDTVSDASVIASAENGVAWKNLSLNPNGGFVGIGTSTPIAALEVDANGTLDLLLKSAGGRAGILGRHSNGTLAAPTATAANDVMLLFSSRGYKTTGYAASGSSAVLLKAAENFTDTATGGYMTFETTPIGTTTRIQQMTLSDTGNLGIGVNSPNFKLDVNGDINIPTGSNFKINGVDIGSGNMGGSGNVNKVPKFTASSTIGDSNITDSGTLVSISTDASINGVKVGRGLASQANNTAVGASTLSSNTSGNFNTAVGDSALTANTSGNLNSAFGYLALASNTVGVQNTGVGRLALNSNTSGNYNSALGDQSLRNVTTGGYNLGLGFSAGSAITTGSSNVVIGSNDGSAIATTSGNILISDGAGNIRMRIDGTGKVGIGSAAPAYALDVTGDVNISAGSNFKINGVNITQGVTGSGTTNRIPKFNSANSVANSNITDSGTLISLSTDASVNGVTVGRGLAGLASNTALGSGVLASNVSGAHNTASGLNALALNTTGSFNTAFGSSTLSANTTGSSNIAVGYSALTANVDGSYNIAQGDQALKSNTSGAYNIAMGNSALFSNTTGNYNLAFTENALYSNTSGIHNIAVGYSTLYNNTTGNYNLATGYNVLKQNTIGSYNIGSGYESLLSNTSGNYNVASGYYALRANTTGAGNVALGANALQANTTGNQNTVVGIGSAGSVTTGSNNTIIGANVDIGNISNSVIIGDGGGGVNSIRIYSNAAGNTGIGKTNPGYKLDVNGDINIPAGSNFKINGVNIVTGGTVAGTGTTNRLAKFTSSTDIGNSNITDNGSLVSITTDTLINGLTVGRGAGAIATNTVLGSSALSSNTTGLRNLAVGYGAGSAITTGSNNVVIGANDGSTIATTDNNIILSDGSGNIRLRANSSGLVSTLGDIQTSGCLYYAGGTLGACASDQRLKKDINAFNLGLDVLLKIRPVNFKYNGLAGLEDNGKVQLGVIAQEVEKASPSLVQRKMVQLQPQDKTPTEIKIVDYGAFTYVIINAIKDFYQKWWADSHQLRAEINLLKDENSQLKKENEDIKKRLERIEQTLSVK